MDSQVAAAVAEQGVAQAAEPLPKPSPVPAQHPKQLQGAYPVKVQRPQCRPEAPPVAALARSEEQQQPVAARQVAVQPALAVAAHAVVAAVVAARSLPALN